MENITDKTSKQIDLTNDYFEGKKIDMAKILQEFQNIAVNHLQSFKSLAKEVSEKNLAFIIIKNVVQIKKEFVLNQKVTLQSKMFKPNYNRADREYKIVDENGQTILWGFSKWCLIDNAKRRSVPIGEISIPSVLKDESNRKQFKLAKNITSKKDFVFDYVVKEKDIDFNNHMNNVAYMNIIKTAAKTFEFNYDNLIINYIKECLIDYKLEIRARKEENNLLIEGYYFDKICFVAKLS